MLSLITVGSGGIGKAIVEKFYSNNHIAYNPMQCESYLSIIQSKSNKKL